MPRPEPPRSQMNLAAIRERVHAEFPPDQHTAVLAELNRYESNSLEGQARIHHAILTLAEGNLEKLRRYVDETQSDFRNVIFWAYHPEEAKVTREQAQTFLDRLKKAGMKNVPKLPDDFCQGTACVSAGGGGVAKLILMLADGQSL